MPPVDVCHMPPSVPFTNTSMRFEPHDDAEGAEASFPPSGSHADHALPFHFLVYRPSSVPRTNRSTCPGAADTAAGFPITTPPSGDHPDQALPDHVVCQS